MVRVQQYTVGKFISPYVISFNERIQVNNEFITDEELTYYIGKIDPIIQKMEKENNVPNGFEIITAIAFMYYNDKKCDIVCLEVGMGGRLDPTNIINTTVISIITLIDFDHTAFLGDTLEKIASEKCGIIKKDKITVTYPKQNKEVLDTIRKFSAKNNNKLYIPSLKLLDIIKCNHNINYFSYKGSYYKLNLIGEYQIYNALMVILASNILINLGYKISYSAINNGISDVKFPARLEKVSDNPLIFVDGTHNAAGAKSLKDFLHEYKGKRNYAIMSFTKGKDYESFLKEIGSFFQEIVFVQYKNEYKHSEDIENLLKVAKDLQCNVTSFNSLKDANNYLINKENVDLILVTGSLYLASDYRNMLTEE
jgi:dihydrofolate synthase/folylpolyglutamate synthase